MIDEEIRRAERACQQNPDDPEARRNLRRARRRAYPGKRVRFRVVPLSWVEPMASRARVPHLVNPMPELTEDDDYEIVTNVIHDYENGLLCVIRTSTGQSFSARPDDLERLPVWTLNLGEVEEDVAGVVRRVLPEQSGRPWVEERL